MEPLDRGLNVAILHVASKLFPCGFDISPDAPTTFAGLVSRFNHSRRITVFSGGSDQTIYGCPEVNYAFRAWHDWCHWKGGHDFTLDGEYDVWQMQCAHLVALYDDNARTRRWCEILYAEIVGRSFHHGPTGEYVTLEPLILAAAEDQQPIK